MIGVPRGRRQHVAHEGDLRHDAHVNALEALDRGACAREVRGRELRQRRRAPVDEVVPDVAALLPQLAVAERVLVEAFEHGGGGDEFVELLGGDLDELEGAALVELDVEAREFELRV